MRVEIFVAWHASVTTASLPFCTREYGHGRGLIASLLLLNARLHAAFLLSSKNLFANLLTNEDSPPRGFTAVDNANGLFPGCAFLSSFPSFVLSSRERRSLIFRFPPPLRANNKQTCQRWKHVHRTRGKVPSFTVYTIIAHATMVILHAGEGK